MILGIHDEHIAGGIDRHLLRRVEHCVARIVIVAAVTARAGPCHGFDDAIAAPGAGCCPGVPGCRANRPAPTRPRERRRCRPAAAGPPSPACCPLPVPANVVMTPAPRSTTRTRLSATSAMNRRRWSRSNARPLGSARPARADGPPSPLNFAGTITGQRGYYTIGIDAPHPLIQTVGHIDVARAIDDDAVRLVHLRFGRRAAVPGEALLSRAGDRRR